MVISFGERGVDSRFQVQLVIFRSLSAARDSALTLRCPHVFFLLRSLRGRSVKRGRSSAARARRKNTSEEREVVWSRWRLFIGLSSRPLSMHKKERERDGPSLIPCAKIADGHRGEKERKGHPLLVVVSPRQMFLSERRRKRLWK